MEEAEEVVSPANPLRIDTSVSDKDIFKLAKAILIVCSIFFVIIAMFKIFMGDAKGISEVWEYSKVFLNSIISLVLG